MRAVIPSEHHVAFLVPAGEIERRLDALRERLGAAGAGLAWIEHLADRLYFSGSAQDGVLLVPAAGEPEFLVRKSRARAERESPVPQRPHPGARALIGALRERLGAGATVGLALDVTPAWTLLGLQQGLERASFVDLSRDIRATRAVKSAWEIEQIRRASDQVTTLYGEIGEHIRPGITELELTARVEGRLRALGHGGTIRVRRPAADVTMGVVVSGASASYPTGFNGPVGGGGPYPPTAAGAGWKRLVSGESVMLDLVTSYNGYHADTTRAFFLGTQVPDRARRAHDFCREILAAIEERMRPGARCDEIYLEVERLARERGEPEGFMGFGENRVRFFGHGVGLELDELPVLAETVRDELRPGHVLAVEPKAFLAGIGPVGVENTYVVTEQGCRSLCPVDDDLRTL